MPASNPPAYDLPATKSATSVPLAALPAVLFDDHEIDIATHLANARLLTRRADEYFPMARNASPLAAQTTTILGELAVRKLLNSREPIYALGRLPWDVTIDGYRAAVETQHLDPAPYPDLVVSADRDLEADLYVLAQRLHGQRIKVIGYCTQESLRNRHPMRLPNGQQALVVPAAELRLLPSVDR